jgi:hypothetical protein
MYVELAILALFVFLYSMVAGRIERSAISGPMVFVIAGFLMAHGISANPLARWIERKEAGK